MQINMEAVSKILSKRSRFVLIVFTVLFAFIWLFPPNYLYFLKGLSGYLPLHMLMETFSIIVAAMIFSVGWEAYGKEKSGNIIIIATAFLAVVFIDFAHMLSFAGMPVFVTESNPEKAIFFWLCGRFFVAVAMLYIVINSWKPLRSYISHYLILTVSLMSTALIYWVGLWHQDALPHTFIPGHGLTPLKIYMEWSVVAILAVAAIFLVKKMLEKKQSYDAQNVLMAIYLMILSEIFFMLYADVADLYNFMGHVYKVAAYYYLYRAIFVENIQKPYKELEEVNTAVSDLYNNAPCGYHSLDKKGVIVMINDTELSWLGYTREEVVGKMKFADILTPASVEIFKENFPQFKERGWIKDIEFELVRKGGTTFPILISATVIKDSGGNYLMSRSTVYDITELKQAEQEIFKLNRIYRMLSDCNQSLIRADNENNLIANICRIITEEGGYRMAWVGYPQNDEEQTVKPVAYAGYEDGYLNQRRFSWGDNEYGRGPTGTAIRTGQYFTVVNYDTDPRFSPWREDAQKRGYASSVAFPLVTDGKPFGALSIYSGTTDAFNKEELMLLQELASDLAFGITTIRTRIEREHVRMMLSEAQRITHIGSWELELESNVLTWSDEIYSIFEIDPAKFGASYEAFLGAIHPDDRDAVNAAYTNSLKTKLPYSIDHRLLFPDGRIKYVHEQCESYYNKDEKPLRSVGTVQDVTELKLAEGALRENEHFLDNIIENIPNMLFVKEAKTLKFVRFNKVGEELLGYSQDELIGKNDYDFFPKEQADFFTSKDHEIISGGKLMDIPEEPINTKSLGQRYLHTKKIPVFADDGTPLYLIGISEDITELREAREALKRLNEGLETKVKERTAQLESVNKELEAFTYSVSHDLRAPLRSIDGFSAAVMEDYGDKVGEGGNEYLQRVRSASQKMATLIDDLLSLSRLTRGELNKTSVNLGNIASDVIRNLREADPDRVVDVIIAENMTAEADSHFMEIVFTNLLNNAWKFTSKKDKAKIEFNCTQKEGKKVYYIKDNGAGFDMNYAKKLFQPFQRLHTAEEFPGTGIGLTTVHRIIKKHGGDIWAEGEVDKGATFYFTLGG